MLESLLPLHPPVCVINNVDVPYLVRDGRQSEEAVGAQLHALGVPEHDSPEEGYHLCLRLQIRPDTRMTKTMTQR